MALPNKAKEVQADLYTPTIPLLELYQEICTRMFMAALLIGGKKKGK